MAHLSTALKATKVRLDIHSIHLDAFHEHLMPTSHDANMPEKSDEFSDHLTIKGAVQDACIALTVIFGAALIDAVASLLFPLPAGLPLVARVVLTVLDVITVLTCVIAVASLARRAFLAIERLVQCIDTCEWIKKIRQSFATLDDVSKWAVVLSGVFMYALVLRFATQNLADASLTIVYWVSVAAIDLLALRNKSEVTRRRFRLLSILVFLILTFLISALGINQYFANYLLRDDLFKPILMTDTEYSYKLIGLATHVTRLLVALVLLRVLIKKSDVLPNALMKRLRKRSGFTRLMILKVS